MPDTPNHPPAIKPDWALSPREAANAWRAERGLPPLRRRWPLIVVLLVAVAGIAAGVYLMSQGTADPEAAPAAETAAPAVMQVNRSEWTEVAAATLTRSVRMVGPIAPAREVELSAEVSGRVETVLATVGDRVAAGDALVQVNVERLASSLRLAESNAEATRVQAALAQEQLTRAQALSERGIAAEAQLDEAAATLDQARATLAAQEEQVAAARLDLRLATVRAPFDGIVLSRTVEPGAVVSAGTPLVTLVDLDQVEMIAAASVAASVRLRRGQEAAVTVDGIDGRSFQGSVTRIAPAAEEGTRTIPVRIAIDNADGTLRGGMFAAAEVITDIAEAGIGVPATALREDAEGTFVLTIEGEAIARRPVSVDGAWDSGLVGVTDGLQPGDRLLTGPVSGLSPGVAVEMVEF